MLAGLLGACLLLFVGGATAATATHWARGIDVVLPANAEPPKHETAGIGSISCPSAGNCSAVGIYQDNADNEQGLLLTETAGHWGAGVEAVLPANAAATDQQVTLNSISCASAGNCAAVGYYVDNTEHAQGLLLTETAGNWSAGVEAKLPANAGTDEAVLLNSVSCPSAGNCVAVGTYPVALNAEALILTETAGTWAQGVEAPLPANAATPAAAGLDAVSCASVGNCSAVGSYLDSSDNGDGVLLTETAGTWATGVEATLRAHGATTIPRGVDLLSVSCPSPGNCTAVGSYDNHSSSLMLTEQAGEWTAGVAASLPANAAKILDSQLIDVACASAGNCTAVGEYFDKPRNTQGLLLTQTGGKWSKGTEAPVPTNANTKATKQFVYLNSVSCASAGNCSVVGNYVDKSNEGQGLLLTEAGGTWTTGVKASLPANGVGGGLASVSCPSNRRCGAGGRYGVGSAGVHGLLMSSSPAQACLAPRLKGKTVGAARHAVKVAGCSIGRVGHTVSQTVAKGRVISQKPKPGTQLKLGAKIDLVVSRGKR